jgi:transposase-like protein
MLGVNSSGTKELLTLGTGFAERSEYWKEMFLGLKERGMAAPKLVIGDEGKGLWKGLSYVYPDCAKQICYVHKKRNVLSHLPKKLFSQAGKDMG